MILLALDVVLVVLEVVLVVLEVVPELLPLQLLLLQLHLLLKPASPLGAIFSSTYSMEPLGGLASSARCPGTFSGHVPPPTCSFSEW